MAHIIIAGRPNSEDTSECVLLAENLQANFPTVRYIKVLKHANEWENYSENVCNLFGFKNSHPLIFYSSGRFIGGKDEFFKMIECNFKFSALNNQARLNIDSQIIKTLTNEHIQITNEEYFQRISGSKLRDKIDKKYEEISREDLETNKNLTRHNTLDSVYETDYIGEMKVYFKYNNKFLPDYNSKEFIEYHEPVENKTVMIDRNNKIINENEQHHHKQHENEEGENSEEETIGPNHIPKKREINFRYNKYYETPTYKFEKKELYVIEEDFGMKYKIVLNPFFSFYGETLIYHDELSSESAFKVHDYGRLPSLRTIVYEDSLLSIIKPLITLPADNKVSFLECNIISDPLISDNDIHYLVKSVKEINGIGMLRILPSKYNDYKQFGSSKIKVLKLPLKDLNYEGVPLCVKVDQTVRSLKREKIKEIMQEDTNKNNKKEKRIDLLLDNEEFTHFFDMKEFVQIESYKNFNVKHLIKTYTWQSFNSSNISKDIAQMMKEFNINKVTGYGFNLLLTKSFLFLCPLVQPFTHDNNNTPLFAEPFFFSGIFNLPLIEAGWPETITNQFVNFEMGKILQKSTNL